MRCVRSLHRKYHYLPRTRREFTGPFFHPPWNKNRILSVRSRCTSSGFVFQRFHRSFEGLHKAWVVLYFFCGGLKRRPGLFSERQPAGLAELRGMTVDPAAMCALERFNSVMSFLSLHLQARTL